MDRLNPRTYLDPDGTMAANSDNRVPTQKAIIAYLSDGGTSGQNRWGKGVDTTDDVIIDSTTSGLVLLDSAGHYWRVTVSTLGELITTDLGTVKP